ncbi:hypothetical protein V8E55_006407 [Tylopilus felleus]
MTPQSIHLIHLQSKSVSSHLVDAISWDKVWTVSHIWDKGGETLIPLKGVSWRSTAFSSANRFTVIFEKACQIVEAYDAEYIWMDTACIDQGGEDEKKEQVPFMATIYSQSAGSVAFGTLTPDGQFGQIAYTYEDGQKAWLCSWFERVWTYQELQLPKVLLFVSGNHVLRRDEVHLSILLILSIHDVLNALSRTSYTNTQRSLMQTSKRGCSSCHIQDKVYGILGVLSHSHLFSKLDVDYNISLAQAVLSLMVLMPSNDVVDTLTFNTLPPGNNVDDALCWSGMVMLDGPMEFPPHEKDSRRPTHAFVDIVDEAASPKTVVCNAPLWKVVVRKSKNTHTMSGDIQDLTWGPSVTAVSQYAKLTDNFSKVELSADHADTARRVQRSLRAHRESLKPLLEEGATDGIVGKEFSSILENPPLMTTPPTPRVMSQNRLGDTSLFDQEVTILVCRSKVYGSFHYGIVVTPNDDGSWHKVCTAAFSDECVIATNRGHVEDLIPIGK